MSEIGWQLIAAVRSAAARDPHHVDVNAMNEGCVYVKDGEPSCIVGQGLWELGLIGKALELIPPPLGAVGPDSIHAPNNQMAENLFRYLKLELDIVEIDWLAAVQEQQDCGARWADAVADADRVVNVTGNTLVSV